MGFDWEYILDSEDVQEAYEELLDLVSNMLEGEENHLQGSAVPYDYRKEIVHEDVKTDACATVSAEDDEKKWGYDDEVLPFGDDC